MIHLTLITNLEVRDRFTKPQSSDTSEVTNPPSEVTNPPGEPETILVLALYPRRPCTGHTGILGPPTWNSNMRLPYLFNALWNCPSSEIYFSWAAVVDQW